jgi:DNA-binding NtrC family response regulator
MPNNPILFVDDDAISCLAHSLYLRERGFTVIAAHRAADAYRLIERHPRLTALISDFDLGLGDNGIDIARRARAVHQGLPVVFISGMANLRQRTDDIRGSVLLAKPVRSQEIVEALWGAIGLEAA